MARFTATETGINGLVILEPAAFGDVRGFFMETYNRRDFEALGISACFVQDNHSKSRRGVLRGMHFQKKRPQGKLVRVVSGEVFDVAVDIRPGSETFGQWRGVFLSAENKKMFWVPEGFAHGFFVLSDEAEFVYKCTSYYDPADEGGIMWNDVTISIDWPLNGMEPLLSDKDKLYPPFAETIGVRA
jgi:dTDP-4-dehydrorhamnose 3,5-epimerase